MTNAGPVVIASFRQPTEAHLARMRLEAEGIEVSLRNENLVSVQPFYTGVVGGVQLVVRPEDAEVSAKIIGSYQSDSHSRYQVDQQRCPNCESEDIRRITELGTLLMVLTLLTLGLAWFLLYRTHKCNKCGHAW